jgi:hypothetical protein
MDFPTAIQARENIDKLNNELFNNLINSIKYKILNSGKPKLDYMLDYTQFSFSNDQLINNVLKFLREKGYKAELVYSTCQWDNHEPYIRIEW